MEIFICTKKYFLFCLTLKGDDLYEVHNTILTKQSNHRRKGKLLTQNSIQKTQRYQVVACCCLSSDFDDAFTVQFSR